MVRIPHRVCLYSLEYSKHVSLFLCVFYAYLCKDLCKRFAVHVIFAYFFCGMFFSHGKQDRICLNIIVFITIVSLSFVSCCVTFLCLFFYFILICALKTCVYYILRNKLYKINKTIVTNFDSLVFVWNIMFGLF